jgi:hypothetical protein
MGRICWQSSSAGSERFCAQGHKGGEFTRLKLPLEGAAERRTRPLVVEGTGTSTVTMVKPARNQEAPSGLFLL